MKILFQRKGSKVDLVDSKICKREDLYDYDEDEWSESWMDYEGLDEPLKSESIVEPLCEIDDMFGQYGFKTKKVNL